VLKGTDILTARQFSRDEIDLIMETATGFSAKLDRGARLDAADGLIMASLFLEPSTRTRLSFEAAMLRLGGDVISVAEGSSSSAAKGESISDAIRTVDGYADVIVLRSPVKGAAQEAATAAEVPVINGGDGSGQHPTQALLDMYTIRRERGRCEGLSVVLAGDLLHGRTVHSLAYLLALYGNHIHLVAPEGLGVPEEIKRELKDSYGADLAESQDLAGALRDCDVVYMTRLQKERFSDQASYEKYKGSYILTAGMLERAVRKPTIMHPLPRVNEIHPEVDALPNAAYFRQAHYGVPVRMALLAMVLGKV